MAKSIREIALAFLFVMCGIGVLMGILWLRPVIESQQLLIEETRKNQKEIMQRAEKLEGILTELGYGIGILAMKEQGVVPQSVANEMIDNSVENIDVNSARLGKLARFINEYRQIKEEPSPNVLYVDSDSNTAIVEYPDGRIKKIKEKELSKIKRFKKSGRNYIATLDGKIMLYDKEGLIGEQEAQEKLKEYKEKVEELWKNVPKKIEDLE